MDLIVNQMPTSPEVGVVPTSWGDDLQSFELP